MLGIVHRGKPIICLLYIKPNIEQKKDSLAQAVELHVTTVALSLYYSVMYVQGRYIWMVIQF